MNSNAPLIIIKSNSYACPKTTYLTVERTPFYRTPPSCRWVPTRWASSPRTTEMDLTINYPSSSWATNRISPLTKPTPPTSNILPISIKVPITIPPIFIRNPLIYKWATAAAPTKTSTYRVYLQVPTSVCRIRRPNSTWIITNITTKTSTPIKIKKT